MWYCSRSYPDEISQISYGFVAETCLLCKNVDMPDIRGCKYVVSSSSPTFDYQLLSYTSEDCSTGEEEASSVQSYEANTCIQEDGYGTIYSILRIIPLPLSSGVEYITMNYEYGSCVTPFSYVNVGYISGACISQDSASNTLSCNNNQVSYSYYENSDCQGNPKSSSTAKFGLCIPFERCIELYITVWH